MKTEQIVWTRAEGWPADPPAARGAQLVLVFGSVECLRDDLALNGLRARYPAAYLFGASTAGEIADTTLLDDSIVATAIELESSRVATASTGIDGPDDSANAGRRLAMALPQDGLVHVLVLSEGVGVNGSQLVEGLGAGLAPGIAITGGLAGHGTLFDETVIVHAGRARSGIAAAIGLYGERLSVGYASVDGWDAFGPERTVTRAEGPVLYGLDGRSALALYKTYLGVHAEELPASALLFPLSVRPIGHATPLVRTVLGVDESAESMRFAGDVPVGAQVRLMKANVERVIEGATSAAQLARGGAHASGGALALLISCVGRRLVLKQRTEEELEAVREVLGPVPALTGFYSYGEIAPACAGARPELHNQTMTVTTIAER
jgi:hypothetical protein